MKYERDSDKSELAEIASQMDRLRKEEFALKQRKVRVLTRMRVYDWRERKRRGEA